MLVLVRFFLHEDFLELFSFVDISIISLPHYSALLHYDDFIDCLRIFDSVGGHNDSLAFEIAEQCLLHQEISNMHIDCAENIIQQINILLGVESSS